MKINKFSHSVPSLSVLPLLQKNLLSRPCMTCAVTPSMS